MFCLSVGKACRSDKGLSRPANQSSRTDFYDEQMGTIIYCLEINCEIQVPIIAMIHPVFPWNFNSTRMKESGDVDVNTVLALSCSILWQCVSPCKYAVTYQSLALKASPFFGSRSLLCGVVTSPPLRSIFFLLAQFHICLGEGRLCKT